jgi:hypothetical protein
MMAKRTGFLAKTLMSAMALFVLVPAVSAQDNGRWRRDQNRQRQEEQRRRQEEWRRRQQQRQAQRSDPRDRDGDGDYDQRDAYIIQQQQRNGGYGTYGNNRGGNNGGYSRRGYGYGNNGYGSYTQSQQTALNAGYNEGVKEGRNDRNRGGYRNVNDFSTYRNANKDYNSRYGDRYEYQMYFRRGFENGYNDGLNGY